MGGENNSPDQRGNQGELCKDRDSWHDADASIPEIPNQHCEGRRELNLHQQ